MTTEAIITYFYFSIFLLCFSKIFNSEFSYTEEVWFTDRNSKPIGTEDYVSY